MAGQRASKDIDLDIAPGFFTNESARDARNRYQAGTRVRFHKGRAEKMLGWVRQTLTGANNGVYIGVCRALHAWASLDTQFWIAEGTNCKLYLVNNSVLSDITPLRKASTVHDPIQTFNASTSVTIHNVDHRSDVGDHIRVYSATAVGGVTVDGDYTIATVIDPDSYTIVVSAPAGGNATGGGDVTIEYDLGCGLAENGELTGYGTGVYGAGTYGTPRGAGTGVQAKLRTWSLDNWGEDLIASPSDGEIYWWDRSSGASARATLLENAPTDVQRILVTPENRQIIAIGCSDSTTGQPDPMRVRWCSQEDFNDWISTDENTAGGKRLDYGSRLITGIKSNKQMLLWSDTTIYLMQPNSIDYSIDSMGSCAIVGPNAAADANGIVRFMAYDDFMIYDGTLRVMPCDIWDNVFGKSATTRLDKTQAYKVHCSTYRTKNEVKWQYPSVSGGGEIDRYVIYNYEDNCWYDGDLVRTAYHEVAEEIASYMTNPFGVNGGYLYLHEEGTDEVEGVTTNVMSWFLESWDMSIGGSDAIYILNQLIPNMIRQTQDLQVILKVKEYPKSPYRTKGPYRCQVAKETMGVRGRGSQVAIRWETGVDINAVPIAGQDFRFGVWQVDGTPHGKR